jgi:hypothetical protein
VGPVQLLKFPRFFASFISLGITLHSSRCALTLKKFLLISRFVLGFSRCSGPAVRNKYIREIIKKKKRGQKMRDKGKI